ncbi:hypothetical protein [Nitratifractor sp.]
MRRMKLREYARNKHLSLFEVVKKIQKGELRSEQVEENGRSVQYILLEEDDATPSKVRKASQKQTETTEQEDPCMEELKKLRRELAQLRSLVESCCGKESL